MLWLKININIKKDELCVIKKFGIIKRIWEIFDVDWLKYYKKPMAMIILNVVIKLQLDLETNEVLYAKQWIFTR